MASHSKKKKIKRKNRDMKLSKRRKRASFKKETRAKNDAKRVIF